MREQMENLLYEYRDIDFEINDLKLYLEEIRAISYDDMPKSPNVNTSSGVENFVLMKEKTNRDIKRLEIKKGRIDNLLNLLNDRDRTILKMYYIDDLTLNDIAKEVELDVKYLSLKKNKLLDRLGPYAVKCGLI